MTPLRVGVIGAGRVGAVLASALQSRGHQIVSVAGESDASLRRIHDLLPGVAVEKPTAVARSCDVLLLTVPDDMLENVVTQLAASGALRAGQYVVHTSGSHGLRGPRAGPPDRGTPRRAAPRDDVHRHRPSISTACPSCVFGVTVGPAERGWAEQARRATSAAT